MGCNVDLAGLNDVPRSVRKHAFEYKTDFECFSCDDAGFLERIYTVHYFFHLISWTKLQNRFLKKIKGMVILGSLQITSVCFFSWIYPIALAGKYIE